MKRKVVIYSICCYIIVVFIIGEVQYNFEHTHTLTVQYKADLSTHDSDQHPARRQLAGIKRATVNADMLDNNAEYKTCLLAFQDKNKCSDVCNVTSERGRTEHDSAECNLEDIVSSCKMFKERYGYNRFPVTDEEREFPIAFAIKMHHLADQAELLLRTIYREHNIYCIHVDSKSSQRTYQIMSQIGACFENVIVIQEREKVVFSSFAHVKSDLKCMHAVYESDIKWMYYVNVEGEDFPLRTNLEMVKIMKNMKGLNDLETYDHPGYLNWRIENRFSVIGNSIVEEAKKPTFKYDLKFSRGNPFGLFTRDFVHFILNDNIGQYIISWFNDTFAPAENVWATLVTLPWAPGNYPVEVRHMVNALASRAMVITGDLPKCHGRFLRGKCSFGCGDFPWLISRPEFFASKFDSEKDPAILNCLHQWYRQKAFNRQVTNIAFRVYDNLPHVRHYKKNPRSAFISATERDDIKREWLNRNLIV